MIYAYKIISTGAEEVQIITDAIAYLNQELDGCFEIKYERASIPVKLYRVAV